MQMLAPGTPPPGTGTMLTLLELKWGKEREIVTSDSKAVPLGNTAKRVTLFDEPDNRDSPPRDLDDVSYT